jgi:UDP-N-acetylglucosamine 2-epimerase
MLWAPTNAAADALRQEGVPRENVFVTGNTVVDALRLTAKKIDGDRILRDHLGKSLPLIGDGKRLVLVTGHRRENFGGGLTGMCHALNRLATREDVEIVWPVHPNPHVTSIVERELRRSPNVHLTPPLNYCAFLVLMMRSYFIITDSGGIQEEAPTLSKPVLVTRDETERPEAIAAGTAKLVGTSSDCIYNTACELLDNSSAYAEMAGRLNPFGDGYAARQIVDTLVSRFGADL